MFIVPEGILINYQGIPFPSLEGYSFVSGNKFSVGSVGTIELYWFWSVTSPPSIQFMELAVQYIAKH